MKNSILALLIFTALTNLTRKNRKGLLLLALASLSSSAWADCTLQPTGTIEYRFNFPASISLSRDLANGSDITTITSGSKSPGNGVTCTTGTSVTFVHAARNGATSTNGITPTGIAGVGMRYRTSSHSTTMSNTTSFSGPPTATITLVKTGPIASNVVLTAGALQWAEVNGLINTRLNVANNVNFVPQTCSVTQPGSVNLGTLPLKTFTGVGSTSPWGSNFTISANCSGVASKVYMVLTDAQNPGNTSSTLSLTSASTASGIGIQIWPLNGSAPINMGPDSAAAGTINQFAVFTSDGSVSGPVQLVFSSRYIQTAAAVKPGIASGLATFTMSYQ